MILQSRASEKSLRVSQDGEVQGTGAHGPFAQFRVHVKRPGVVSLQNVKNPDYWLAVFQGKTVGTVINVYENETLLLVEYIMCTCTYLLYMYSCHGCCLCAGQGWSLL